MARADRPDSTSDVRPPLRGLFRTKAGRILLDLLASRWTPQQVAGLEITGLKTLFAERGCQLKVTVARRLLDAARRALPPHPAATAGKAATPSALLTGLDGLDEAIAGIEAEMATRLPLSEGAKLPRSMASVSSSPADSSPSSAQRIGGRTGPRYGEVPASTQPAPSPGPPTPACRSAARARRGGHPRSGRPGYRQTGALA